MSPFRETLTRLLEERDWSLRDLAHHCQTEFNGWGEVSTLSGYQTGKSPPNRKALERLATVLRTSPTVFVEYQLILAQDDFNPERVGWQNALANLAAWQER